jgi:hypothetical protein
MPGIGAATRNAAAHQSFVLRQMEQWLLLASAQGQRAAPRLTWDDTPIRSGRIVVMNMGWDHTIRGVLSVGGSTGVLIGREVRHASRGFPSSCCRLRV